VPRNPKRPTDVIGNAVHAARIATGEIEDDAPPQPEKNTAAAELGRTGSAERAKSHEPRKAGTQHLGVQPFCGKG